jgi:pyrroloquinoline quinone biosynthesis protein D
MNTIDQQQCVNLAPGVRWQIDRATGEAVLLYPEGILMLNETAREVVARCDGKTTMAEIVVALAAEYESSPAELENDIAECLGDLHRKKLIVFAP